MSDTHAEGELSGSEAYAFKDRKAGLVLFGVLTVMMGGVSALCVPLMLVAQMAASKIPSGPSQAPAGALVPAFCTYGILAVALVWLGIGSIMARRWARALLLIFSWGWLIIGVIMIGFMAWEMPAMVANINSGIAKGGQAQPAAGTAGAMMIAAMCVLGVLFLILPAIWTFFYSSRHVKATCDARDATPRWTDACPLPVLAIVLCLIFSVPMLVIMPFAGHFVFPFFGNFLTGTPSIVLCLVLAIVWAFAAWGMYKLDPRGWWAVLILSCVMSASSMVTFARHDLAEMYRLMNYSRQEIAQINGFGLLTGNGMVWMMTGSLALYLGYMFYIRRYFRFQQ